MESSNSHSDKQTSEVNLTPMLDVVFILLIFFIVTASFIRETGIDVNKPEASTPPDIDAPTILVGITENNEIWIDRRMVDPRAVRDNIARLRTEVPNGIVVIQADERSRNKVLVQVMDAVRQAGIDQISLATNPK